MAETSKKQGKSPITAYFIYIDISYMSPYAYYLYALLCPLPL